MEKQQYAIGDRVEKSCLVCGESRGHIVASINKLGRILRVSCPQCDTRSTFKRSDGTKGERLPAPASSPYDRIRTYRKGQAMMHPIFGLGEVTALIEPRKIDVLFSDRIRRLIHAQG